MMDVAWERRVAARGPSSQGEVAQAAGEKPETQSAITSALKNIMTYIPGEIVTTYVAVVAVLPPVTDGASTGASITPWVVFFVFLALTPIVSWLIYAAKAINAGDPPPWSIAKWPKWEMTAATVAYVIWAAALPDNPFNGFAWYSAGVSGIILLVCSMMLGLIAPIFTRTGLPASDTSADTETPKEEG
jgi:hypothetical protein